MTTLRAEHTFNKFGNKSDADVIISKPSRKLIEFVLIHCFDLILILVLRERENESNQIMTLQLKNQFKITKKLVCIDAKNKSQRCCPEAIEISQLVSLV